ncbi:extracellular solute-binding protein [Paenibacillus sp. J5C_2022]|uniref:extracellular solute-binding protein n=1 Tax=Paenibacillus sp. J5C2022 TaxID=2977129 RepID=UPI0021D3E45D|nr:extracellular solute-binding protein [Paenibacillus sp. J5C2022]MCU6712591.1 extracellular solute-binding protein [Paenibacillus sp. J5C2022]
MMKGWVSLPVAFRWGLLAAVAAMLTATGCSHYDAGAKVYSEHGEADDMTISFLFPAYEEMPERLHIWTYMEERFNIRFVPLPESANSYSAKLKAAAASGKLPDLVTWTSSQSELINHVRSGLFHDLTSYVERSEHLRQLPPDILEHARLDGRLYGIPRPRAKLDDVVMVRKDWLDKLGLPVPHTTEDYFHVAALFGQGDPDGNGKADTYGFAAGEGLNYLHELFLPFGAGNGWLLQEDGSLMASKITPGREKGLLWMRELYKQRGIDHGFGSLKTTKVWDRFMEGTTGIIIAPVSDYARFVDGLKDRNEEAELIMLGPPEGPEGIAGFAEQAGFYGWLLIPSTVPLDKVDRIMEWLDWQSGEDAYTIRRQGLEGIHYERDGNGSIRMKDADALRKEGTSILMPMTPYDPYFYISAGAPSPIRQRQKEALDMVADAGIPNPAIGFMPEEGISTASIYGRKIAQFESDFVKGKLPASSFASFREEWLARGGEQATREVNEWYGQSR